ncbi:hypothetical protein EAS64_33705 [Trebonia kvetii]|uniref:Zinc finger CHC2-type domain-containing protein n=1 Tax=Trebonia kvetii TaxID=2480626 RepID=A0A6P2BRE1_9ACTN|nr:hypothetical protein EAS64_33705 [Trebonia kvetii]
MSEAPIGPVLEHYGWDGRMTGYGAWPKTRCPFHTDRNPSASVNEEAGLFQCHAGCFEGRVISAYGIVMEMESCDFTIARERVKELTGHDGDNSRDGVSLSRRPSGRLASSKLPAWTRDQRTRNRLASSRRSRRSLPGARRVPRQDHGPLHEQARRGPRL